MAVAQSWTGPMTPEWARRAADLHAWERRVYRVVEIDHGWKKHVRAMRRSGPVRVEVGYLAGAAERTGEESGIGNAALAVIHEFGTRRIEARPTLGPTADANWRRYLARARGEAYAALVAGRSMTVAAGISVGPSAVADTARAITNLRSPPNTPATIERKGSSNPLIDTGGMRQAVDWRIRTRAF